MKLEWCKLDMCIDRWNVGLVFGCIDCYGYFGRIFGDKVRVFILLWIKFVVFIIIGIDCFLFNVVFCSKCKILERIFLMKYGIIKILKLK